MTNIEIILLMIDLFFGGLYPNRQLQAEKYAHHIVEASIKENIDPIAIAVIIPKESSWKINAKGIVGEIGLMQINTKQKHLFKNPIDNIYKGAQIYASKLKQCKGDNLLALEAYISGKCKRTKRGLFRYREYKSFTKLRKIGRNSTD